MGIGKAAPYGMYDTVRSEEWLIQGRAITPLSLPWRASSSGGFSLEKSDVRMQKN